MVMVLLVEYDVVAIVAHAAAACGSGTNIFPPFSPLFMSPNFWREIEREFMAGEYRSPFSFRSVTQVPEGKIQYYSYVQSLFLTWQPPRLTSASMTWMGIL